ncbi:sulfonate transport system ATP-binding protein [Hydrogenispora ethanolica]|uniref:Sulfonate transport system ATP-binding protein n=1 Tax=Hydrogenispora ethanolica TaxID=1082276 RepID=A0A4R1QTP5_HYDET|nr:ABC transporter ATP-binding protein [Hydrogenispora ethanolica]TCL56473.1 sulfonate transport system ATP-binding protein [Hydrogenispora ethanolica]
MVQLDNSAMVSIENVSKTFHSRTKDVLALQKVSLNVRKGEFLAILGPSGCGKTTLLRMIAGLETDYEGNITVEGERIVGPSLGRGMAFQEHRLLPWLTIKENVALGLEGSEAGIAGKVQRYLEKVGLEGFGHVYPSQLSGGMAQRAAIARALVNQPKVLLLDEPFGALDAITRVRMQAEIERIWLAERTTMILITHDIDEAVYLGDRVAVMTGRPGEIKALFNIALERPRDRNTADYVSIRKQVHNALEESMGTFSI